MATQQNVVYYDGVPYVSSAPVQQQQGYGGYPMMNGMYSNGGFWGNSLGGSRNQNLSFDQQMERGWLTPLKAPAPPAPTRPVQPLTEMPQAGWGAPQAPGATGGSGSLDAILNGSAPQFAAAPTAPPAPAAQPQQGQMPPPAQGTPLRPGTMPVPQGAPNGMPSPANGQQNFDALGKNLMAQVLNPGGM